MARPDFAALLRSADFLLLEHLLELDARAISGLLVGQAVVVDTTPAERCLLFRIFFLYVLERLVFVEVFHRASSFERSVGAWYPLPDMADPARAPLEAILFDLDGTLLDVDLRVFLRAYFQRLGEAFADIADPAAFLQLVRESTAAMMHDIDASRTNEQVFWDDFLSKAGFDRAVLAPRLERFYEDDFGRLRGYADRKPLARDVVKAAMGLGVPVVLATNPIFPLRAIVHRMEWAGVVDLPFALVTAYETMHACKPHREYYAEIADALGVQANRCLMVGNDEDDDMSAQDLGMTCFLVKDHAARRRTTRPIDLTGSLGDLMEYLR